VAAVQGALGIGGGAKAACLSGMCSSNTIVIGETMEDIRTVAKQLQEQGINAKWYQAWKKYWPDRILTPPELDANLVRNGAWITSKITQGYTILDLGRNPENIDAGKAISVFIKQNLMPYLLLAIQQLILVI